VAGSYDPPVTSSPDTRRLPGRGGRVLALVPGLSIALTFATIDIWLQPSQAVIGMVLLAPLLTVLLGTPRDVLIVSAAPAREPDAACRVERWPDGQTRSAVADGPADETNWAVRIEHSKRGRSRTVPLAASVVQGCGEQWNEKCR
jgi:hypothetical protein